LCNNRRYPTSVQQWNNVWITSIQVLLQLLNAVAGVINDEGLMVNCTPTKNDKAVEFIEAMDLDEFNSPNANGENASPNAHLPRTGTLLSMLEQNMSQLQSRHSWVGVGSNDASWAINNESLVDIEAENYRPPFYRFGCEEGKVTAIQLIDDKTFLEVNPPSEPVYMKPRAKKEEARKATTTTRFF
jgi:hypothetical protein